MDYSKKTVSELISLCKERNLKGYSNKSKSELITLLENPPQEPIKICRLNYIGSKFQLLDWILETILETTGWESFEYKTIADLFAGTGIVSYHFRTHNSRVLSNDAEYYSYVIAYAFTQSVYSPTCKEVIATLNTELQDDRYLSTIGFITDHYSPHNSNERKFFTVDNAKRIDYIRCRLESLKPEISNQDYMFLLASLILSADSVSNVPAVYGCFLKNFKSKALKHLTLQPIHTNETATLDGSKTFNSDVLNKDFLDSIESDLVYLDPPYNERQYSKNYFPLNMIAKSPESLLEEEPLKGKTGIPSGCFLSPFCKKGSTVENAFETLFQSLKTKWIVLSYNSESIITKEKMISLMEKYGTVSVVEKEYKRFKSFEYNDNKQIKEYLFCLKKNNI